MMAARLLMGGGSAVASSASGAYAMDVVSKFPAHKGRILGAMNAACVGSSRARVDADVPLRARVDAASSSVRAPPASGANAASYSSGASSSRSSSRDSDSSSFAIRRSALWLRSSKLKECRVLATERDRDLGAILVLS